MARAAGRRARSATAASSAQEAGATRKARAREGEGDRAALRLLDDVPPYYVPGKGWMSEAQARAGARAAAALRDSIRAMDEAAGAAWTAGILREELARLDARTRTAPHRPKGSKVIPLAELCCLVAAMPDASANACAKVLHEIGPGKFGASVASIAKAITRLRADIARRGESEVFQDAVLLEMQRRMVATGFPAELARELIRDPKVGWAAYVRSIGSGLSPADLMKRGRDK